MREDGDHYECVAKHIDNILLILKDPKAILDLLKKAKEPYKFKSAGSLMGWKLKRNVNNMDSNFHGEIDDLDFLISDDISKYRMMVGILNWLVTLECYDIHYSIYTLAHHMMLPMQGHLHDMHQVLDIYFKTTSSSLTTT
eukprot:6554190-Ditylum_brightwellii.AAC.1